MRLRGSFEGTFESVWSMEVPQAEWDLYLQNNPNFNPDNTYEMEDMWDHFKSIGCYDECDDSADIDKYMTGIETFGVDVDVN